MTSFRLAIRNDTAERNRYNFLQRNKLDFTKMQAQVVFSTS